MTALLSQTNLVLHEWADIVNMLGFLMHALPLDLLWHTKRAPRPCTCGICGRCEVHVVGNCSLCQAHIAAWFSAVFELFKNKQKWPDLGVRRLKVFDPKNLRFIGYEESCASAIKVINFMCYD